jgi:HrpA-like RNA helicase
MMNESVIQNACQNLYSRGANDEAKLVRTLGDRIRDLEAQLATTQAQAEADASRYAGLVAAITPIADMAGISGVEFARKHPVLNAELDRAGAESWGAILADRVFDALTAWEAHNEA